MASVLTQFERPVQNVYAIKTLVFVSPTGNSVTVNTYTDRTDCRPEFNENGTVSNICISFPDYNMCAIITLLCYPVPSICRIDNPNASFMLGAVLSSIDGVPIPTFENPNPPQQREYIHGNSQTEHIMIMRNSIKQEICSALYIHAALTLDWIYNIVELGGNVYRSPRIMYFQGDENAQEQKYSGVSNKLSPWDIPTKKLRDIVKENTGFYYNAALYNYYTDGTRYIAEHSDNEALNSMVWGLTLGGARDFQFRRLMDKRLFTVKLYHGDIMEMVGPSIQKEWHHGLPKRAYAEPRISVTMRWVGTIDSPFSSSF